MKKTPDHQKPEAKPKPRVVGYGFSCGSGPCKLFRVFDGTPLPKLPAPTESEPGKLKPQDSGAEA